MKLSREVYEAFLELSRPIVENEAFQRQRAFKQHGTTSIYDHVINVTLHAFKKAYKKKGKYDLKAIVYGGLLHDFFLYDWHVFDHKNGHERFHGFNHPKIALKNAMKVWTLSPKEQNIIRSHMWPLTLFHFPKSKEAWLITLSDKKTSILEIFRIKEELEIC